MGWELKRDALKARITVADFRGRMLVVAVILVVGNVQAEGTVVILYQGL